MPELPEVETVRRGLEGPLRARKLVSVEVRRHDLREPIPKDFAARTRGRSVVELGRRGKYLLLHLDDGTVIIGHLGMSGRMLVRDGQGPQGPHDHVRFVTAAEQEVVFCDPRRFGLLLLSTRDKLAQHPLFKDMGPEPLGDAFSTEVLRKALGGRRAPLKALLLDQTVVAGLGNIYVSEALHRARLLPQRSGDSVSRAEAGRLVTAIREVLTAAIAAGGSTLRDYVSADGEIGGFQGRFLVYDRAGNPCPTAGCRGKADAVIQRVVQAGRSTYFCPRCQK